MKNKIILATAISIVLMGCSVQQPESYSQNGNSFYVPKNWDQPIKKSDVASNSSQPSNSDFKPVFPGIQEHTTFNPVNDNNPQPPQKDNFKPVFGNSPDSSAAPPQNREQMVGIASWYGPGFHGKKTADGERYDQNKMTAAHKLLPMNTWVQVTNLENNKVVVVRINDRGPYKKGRILDLTKAAAEKLDFKDKGTAKVSLKVLRYPKDYDHRKGLDPYKQVVVQIAVFRGEDRAYNFKGQLSRKYHSIPFMIEAEDGKGYHVVAGPYEERQKAMMIARALKKEGIDNFIRSYKK